MQADMASGSSPKISPKEIFPGPYCESPLNVPPQRMAASASPSYSSPRPPSLSFACTMLSAYACLSTSAIQLPNPLSCVLTTSDRASNGVRVKHTGLVRASDTEDNKDLTSSSNGGDEGEEGST